MTSLGTFLYTFFYETSGKYHEDHCHHVYPVQLKFYEGPLIERLQTLVWAMGNRRLAHLFYPYTVSH